MLTPADGPSRIVNLPPDESDAILPFLIRHAHRPEFTYRHRWSEGDVVIWDNRATHHYAVFDFAGRRIVHRVGIAGTAPSAEPVRDDRSPPEKGPHSGPFGRNLRRAKPGG